MLSFLEKEKSKLTFIKNKQKINDINAYLLIAFAFALPLTVAGANIIDAFIVLLWLVRGTFKEDWSEVKNNKVVLAVLGFYLLHIVGLLWTEDMQWGLHILKKETKFLMIPIFMLFVRREHVKYYIYAFLLAMSISEILSYGVWFEVIPEFKNARIENPTPFMSHISYNPFLAIAIYLLLHSVTFNKELNNNQRFIYLIFAITMSINMFITGGRAGQVMFFAMLIIVVFQYFRQEMIKAIIIISITIPLIFIFAYNLSDLFNKRMNDAITNTLKYDTDKNSSVGERYTFWINSYEIIELHPFIGVGTGDFKNEYKKVNQKNTPSSPDTDHPHNMYFLELVQFGILGFISLLSILFYQVKNSLRNDDLFIRYIGITFPLLFSIIMLSDSYLLGHYTGMLFIFFSSFLYKNYDFTQKTKRELAK